MFFTSTFQDLSPEALGKAHLGAFKQLETLRAQGNTLPDHPHHSTIVVVHASVGSGHRSAALATAQALCALRDEGLPAYPDGSTLDPTTRIVVIDILDWGRHHYDGNKFATGFTGATRPFYDVMWRYTFTGRLLWGQGTFLNYYNWKLFTRYLNFLQPDAVIATHIMGANISAGARIINKQHFPLICVPTDYETEGLWPHRATDCFCVGTETMAETLRARKISDERIEITGIPTRLDFRQTYDSTSARRRLGLPEDKKLLLALAGATLPQPYVNFRRTLLSALPAIAHLDDFHLVVVCGKDPDFMTNVKGLCRAMNIQNVTVFEYVEGMAELMASSDVIITKSGGLTVTECLCSSTPMILVGRAYGQEKVNVNMLTSNGAAIHVTTPRELVEAFTSIDKYPDRVRAMIINANVLRMPNAAIDVAKKALELSVIPSDKRLGFIPKRAGWLAFFTFYWGDKPAHIR